jgi:hypothetical protein
MPVIHFADEPGVGAEFFLRAVRPVLRADRLGFKGDDRLTNVPVIGLGIARRIVCCRSRMPKGNTLLPSRGGVNWAFGCLALALGRHRRNIS